MNFEIFYISNHLGVDHKCDRKTDKRDVSRPKTEALAYRKVNKSAKDLRNRTQINHINSDDRCMKNCIVSLGVPSLRRIGSGT